MVGWIEEGGDCARGLAAWVLVTACGVVLGDRGPLVVYVYGDVLVAGLEKQDCGGGQRLVLYMSSLEGVVETS